MLCDPNANLYYPHLRNGNQGGGGEVFKIEVFNALQTRFGPSKNLLSNQPFKAQPQIKKTSLDVFNIICPPQEPTNVGHCH
jgi:hypothetical protein